MDPKALSGLDPKFRETYERIMGTSTQSSSSPAATTPTIPVDTAPPPPTELGTEMPGGNPTSQAPADYFSAVQPIASATDAFSTTPATPTPQSDTIVITSPDTQPEPASTPPSDPGAQISPTEGIPFSTISTPQESQAADPAPAMPAPGETAFASAPESTSFSTPPPPSPVINPLSAVDNAAGVAISSIGSLNPTPQPPVESPQPTLADSLMAKDSQPPPAVADISSNQLVTPAPAYTAESLGIQPTIATAAASPAAGVATSPTLLKALYIVGGIIFFILYTIFWIKVFNLPFIF